MSESIRTVLSEFTDLGRIREVHALGNNGGFSGARLWKIIAETGVFCLRAWPHEMASSQLRFIHQTLARVRLPFTPTPIATRTGPTFIRAEDRYWELTRWMPGTADFSNNPTPQRLSAAMSALAQFHSMTNQANRPQRGFSPTLRKRVDELRLFWRGESAYRLGKLVPDGRWPEMDERAIRMLARVTEHRKTLDHYLKLSHPVVCLQRVIRDVWHDHILFEGSRVTGLIDFGTMSLDSPAVDIARLLGSLVGSDRSGWTAGLEAYRAISDLPADTAYLLDLLNITGIFAGGLIWLRMHYLDGKKFEDPAGVLGRVDHFLDRMTTLELELASPPQQPILQAAP